MRTVSFILLVSASIYALQVFADGKHASARAWSPYACCHRMDDTPHHPGVLVDNYLVPEFFYYDTLHRADSSYIYQCYDAHDSLIDADTVMDFANVFYISLFKTFIDHAHTYKDNNGVKQPLPVTAIVQRYDRVGKNKWMSIAYPGNKFSDLHEYRDDIVRIDSFKQTDTIAHVTAWSIYKYYKVAPVK